MKRSKLRFIHLVAAVGSVVLVYAPPIDAATSRTLLRVVVLPALGLSGCALWKLAGVQRRLRNRRAARSAF